MNNTLDFILCFKVVEAEVELFERFDVDKRNVAINHIMNSVKLLNESLIEADAVQKIIHEQQILAHQLSEKLQNLLNTCDNRLIKEYESFLSKKEIKHET